MPIVQDILEKNIMPENFLSQYIFSSSKEMKVQMVQISIMAFDYRRYMKKFLNRVNILEDTELIRFYDKMSEMAQ